MLSLKTKHKKLKPLSHKNKIASLSKQKSHSLRRKLRRHRHHLSRLVQFQHLHSPSLRRNSSPQVNNRSHLNHQVKRENPFSNIINQQRSSSNHKERKQQITNFEQSLFVNRDQNILRADKSKEPLREQQNISTRNKENNKEIHKERSSLKKEKQKKQEQTSKKVSKKKDIKIVMENVMMPERNNLLFEASEKNKCQKMVDALLEGEYTFVNNSFSLQEAISCNEDKQYIMNLHEVKRRDNNMHQLCFISKNRLPSMNHIKLFLPKDQESIQPPQLSASTFSASPAGTSSSSSQSSKESQFCNGILFNVEWIEQLSFNLAQMKCIYSFNVNFLKDLTQEGTQVVMFDFNEYMNNSTSHKLLHVITQSFRDSDESESLFENFNIKENWKINFGLMESFNCQKEKQYQTIPPRLFLRNECIETYKSSLEESKQIIESRNNSGTTLPNQSQSKVQQLNYSYEKKENCQKDKEINSDGEKEQLNEKESLNRSGLKGRNCKIVRKTCKAQINKEEEEEENESENKEEECKSERESMASAEEHKIQESEEQKESGLINGQFWHDFSETNNSFNESSLIEDGKKICESRSVLQKITSAFVRHLYLIQDSFQVVDIIDPTETTLSQYITKLSHHVQLDYQSIYQKLHFKKGLDPELLKSTTIYECLYNQPQIFLGDHCQMFHTVRKSFASSQGIQNPTPMTSATTTIDSTNEVQGGNTNKQKGNNNTNISQNGIFNRKNPLVLVKKTLHLKNFELLNDHPFTKSNIFSIKHSDFKDSKLSLNLLPMEQFAINPLPIDQQNILLLSFGIFQSIKEVLIAQQFTHTLTQGYEDTNSYSKFNAEKIDLGFQSPELILESLSMPSYDRNKNLELLEVLGDVVIKYISSLFLFSKLPDQGESILTHARSLFINNKFLGITAFQNGLHFYARVKKPSSYDWRLNLFSQSQVTDTSESKCGKLNYSNLSDMLEAVIGGFYEGNHYKIRPILDVCSSLGLTINRQLRVDYQQQVNGSFLIPKNILDQINVEEKMTYFDLFQLSQKVQLNKNYSANHTREEIQQKKCAFKWNKIHELFRLEIEFKNKFLEAKKDVQLKQAANSLNQKNQINKNELKDEFKQVREFRREYKKFKQLHSEALHAAIDEFERNYLGYRFKDKKLLVTALNCGQIDLKEDIDFNDETGVTMEPNYQKKYYKSSYEEIWNRKKYGNTSRQSDEYEDQTQTTKHLLSKTKQLYKDQQLLIQSQQQLKQLRDLTQIKQKSINEGNNETSNAADINQPTLASETSSVSLLPVENKEILIFDSDDNQNFEGAGKKKEDKIKDYTLGSWSYNRDYQIYEFLGDSVIEILVVSCARYLTTIKKGFGLQSPYSFCELKSLLLSNDFLSRIVVLNNFHNFALNTCYSQREEISKFIELCDFNTMFSDSVSHQNTSPKVLGDIWESVAAAVLMDSDVDTFTQVYGKLYAPFIIHFVQYYDKLIFNEKEKVQLIAQQSKCSFEIKASQEYDKKKQIIIITKQVFLNNKLVGVGKGDSDLLADRKAFHQAYQALFIKKSISLGIIYLGKEM